MTIGKWLFERRQVGRLAPRWLRETEGLAAIEFAFMAPFLLALVLGIADLGLGFEAQFSVIQASDTGAYYAMVNASSILSNGGLTTAGASQVTQAVQGATSLSGVTATPVPSASCGCPNGNAVTTATCGTTCASTGATTGVYATIGAQYSYSTILPYPWLTNPVTLSASTTLRVQ